MEKIIEIEKEIKRLQEEAGSDKVIKDNYKKEFEALNSEQVFQRGWWAALESIKDYLKEV